MARTAADVLESQGFGGERLLRLARKIANDELRRRGGFLDSERLDDLVAYLALAGVRACVRYDPERVQSRYGRDGGDPFASWLADILAHRVTDWYRSKAEGHGDRRKGLDNRIVLDGEMAYSEPGDAFELEVEANRQERRLDFDEAEAAIAERYALSEEARYGLHLIRLRAEGYKPRGEGTLIAQRIARESLKP